MPITKATASKRLIPGGVSRLHPGHPLFSLVKSPGRETAAQDYEVGLCFVNSPVLSKHWGSQLASVVSPIKWVCG